MIWINCGSGNDPLPKPWINIDIKWFPGNTAMHESYGKVEDYDWEQGDFRDLSKWSDGSVSRVNICHALEHVCFEDAMKTLSEITRVLKSGGNIQIEVPDLEKVMYGYFSDNEFMDLIYGGNGQATYTEGHYSGYTILRLMGILHDLSFMDIKEVEVGFGAGRPEPDRNFRIEGTKC